MNKIRFKVCPKCGARRFIIKNNEGKTIVVNVTVENEIIPINSDDKTDGFNTDDLHCVGCSWIGSKFKLLRYLLMN